MASPIYKSCDQRLRFRKVKDINNTPLNAGTVTFTIRKRSDGTELSTGVLPYIADSAGDYWVTVDKVITDNVIVDDWYDIEVVYIDSDGNDSTQYLECYGALKK